MLLRVFTAYVDPLVQFAWLSTVFRESFCKLSDSFTPTLSVFTLINSSQLAISNHEKEIKVSAVYVVSLCWNCWMVLYVGYDLSSLSRTVSPQWFISTVLEYYNTEINLQNKILYLFTKCPPFFFHYQLSSSLCCSHFNTKHKRCKTVSSFNIRNWRLEDPLSHIFIVDHGLTLTAQGHITVLFITALYTIFPMLQCLEYSEEKKKERKPSSSILISIWIVATLDPVTQG